MTKHLENISIYDWEIGNYKLKPAQIEEAQLEMEAILIKLPNYKNRIKELANHTVDGFNAETKGDIVAKMHYNAMKSKLNNKDKDDSTIWDICVNLERIYGVPIDPKVCSVVRWYAYIINSTNGNK